MFWTILPLIPRRQRHPTSQHTSSGPACAVALPPYVADNLLDPVVGSGQAKNTSIFRRFLCSRCSVVQSVFTIVPSSRLSAILPSCVVATALVHRIVPRKRSRVGGSGIATAWYCIHYLVLQRVFVRIDPNRYPPGDRPRRRRRALTQGPLDTKVVSNVILSSPDSKFAVTGVRVSCLGDVQWLRVCTWLHRQTSEKKETKQDRCNWMHSSACSAEVTKRRYGSRAILATVASVG